MQHDPDGHIIEVGARTRTIPPALRRALHHRDHGCRFPGCGLPLGEGHHIRHWAQGGPTTLSNLALLCHRHHRAVHEEGYHLDQQPDGALRFRRPDGRPLPDVPPPAAVPADPVQVLRARHDAQGLRLHARTACPGWLGERLDLAWAIDVLHPLATRAVELDDRLRRQIACVTSIKAEIDEEAWATLHSDTARVFDKPTSGRIAVKVINHLATRS